MTTSQRREAERRWQAGGPLRAPRQCFHCSELVGACYVRLADGAVQRLSVSLREVKNGTVTLDDAGRWVEDQRHRLGGRRFARHGRGWCVPRVQR